MTPHGNELTPQDRPALETLLQQLQTVLNDSTPAGIAIRERDHFHKMWDDIMQEVLANLQGIRRDQQIMRDRYRTVEEATQAIETMIAQAKNEILQAITKAKNKIMQNAAQQSLAASATAPRWWKFNP